MKPMKTLSISHLAGLFLLAIVGVVGMMMGYLWLEMDRVSREIHHREIQSARSEVADGLNELLRRTQGTANDLALWDETRQQLSFPDYYALWRDSRVRDAGMVSDAVQAVALYDKHGRILAPASAKQAMPQRLPGTSPIALLGVEGDSIRLTLFRPVHADPDGRILLGHVGLRLDFAQELKSVQSYRYADLSRLQVRLPAGSTVHFEQARDHLIYDVRPNPDLAAFHELLRTILIRLAVVVLVLLYLAAWLLLRLVVRPLRLFSDELDALRDHGGSLPPRNTGTVPILELENMRRAFSDYQAHLAELHDNLEQNNRDFHDQARRDALTGCFNRRAFDEDWKSLGEDRRLGKAALLLFDCDHFKAINDTYGHPVGDHVIETIAHALHSALRSDDRLYRLGGDEFATILKDADANRAEAVAERCIEHVLNKDFRQYGLTEPVTISIGISLSEGEGLTLHDLLKRADLAMYTAKRPGSRKLVFYSENMDDMAALVGNREISAVFQAIENSQLIELHYQSVMRMPLAEQDYMEALTRIRFEDKLIGPAAIFPIVQARHLDVEFDLAVLAALSRDLQRLPAHVGVSLNLSAPSIINGKVVDAVVALVGAHRSRKIVVEITETALITQIETASRHIHRLREAGCLVALDDFGSGYSSLRYLTAMPVDLVKFDISMVRLLESGDRRQQLMMQDITNLVLTAGYGMVAEGVESRELLDKVIALGFSHAQGYYFDAPQPCA